MVMRTHPEPSGPAVDVSAALLQRHDVPGPRYTSYPTADRFVEAFGHEQYRRALWQRSHGSLGLAQRLPLSLYVHLPFCESLCYFCACNKVVTRHHERTAPYLDALQIEIDLHVAQLGSGLPVTQLHLGGGSPTFLDDAELEQLMTMLRRAWTLAPQAEVAIEVDPRTVTPARLAFIRSLGFNRLSFGVQDFDEQVQQAVHRIQPREQVAMLIAEARALGFESTNVDLIYGLPRQTPESVARTVREVCDLRPDRVALYGYAHLPQRFKPQRRIHAQELPRAADKVQMLASAIAGFVSHGYVHIGMDHFALPQDPLAAARRQGRLHRNFQGYTVQGEQDLVGLGVSAIGRIGATYSQNAKTVNEYQDALLQGQFPVVRGLALNRDDLLRRAVIMAIMCQGRVDFESIELAHLVDMKDVFAAELQALRPLQDQGLVVLEDQALQVTPLGWYFVRAVAMVFDRYLQADQVRERFSRVI
jgi:oxygen-independent coproporphyrinogen III oxidase